jgi:glycosyltransferase involved in cell wall biosynthesis
VGSSLRVCHLGKYYPPAPGGIETYVRTLALAQAELGAEVSVLCVNHLPGPTVRENDGPVRVTRVSRLAEVAKLDVCPELVSELTRVRADVLHLHVPNPTMILALAALRPRTPIVVTYQSDHVRQRVRGALFRPFEHAIYRRVRAILATSPPYAEGSELLRRYRDKVRVVPMGIDLRPYLEPLQEHLEVARTLRERHPGPIWVGCGRLIYYKGFVNAIRALPRVPGTFLLVGDGPEHEGLEAEAARLGVRERVVFIGEKKYQDVVPYYHAAHAFWFPSNARSEAFGLVQVEAMASGCPVINTAIPASGVAWVSPHGETGLTVPMDDPGAFAKAANQLAADHALRDRLGKAARARAKAEFDRRVMAERTVEVYGRPVLV